MPAMALDCTEVMTNTAGHDGDDGEDGQHAVFMPRFM